MCAEFALDINFRRLEASYENGRVLCDTTISMHYHWYRILCMFWRIIRSMWVSTACQCHLKKHFFAFLFCFSACWERGRCYLTKHQLAITEQRTISLSSMEPVGFICILFVYDMSCHAIKFDHHCKWFLVIMFCHKSNLHCVCSVGDAKMRAAHARLHHWVQRLTVSLFMPSIVNIHKHHNHISKVSIVGSRSPTQTIDGTVSL